MSRLQPDSVGYLYFYLTFFVCFSHMCLFIYMLEFYEQNNLPLSLSFGCVVEWTPTSPLDGGKIFLFSSRFLQNVESSSLRI